MDIFFMQHNYRNKHLVEIDGNVYVYIYEGFKFDQPFHSFQEKTFLLVHQKFAK